MADGTSPALPAGFAAISDARLAELLDEGRDKTLSSALIELQMRRAVLAGAGSYACATRDDHASVDHLLVSDLVDDTLHNAMCMQLALAHWAQQIDENEPTGDMIYGRWLLNSTVAQLMRVAKWQLQDEIRPNSLGIAGDGLNQASYELCLATSIVGFITEDLGNPRTSEIPSICRRLRKRAVRCLGLRTTREGDHRR